MFPILINYRSIYIFFILLLLNPADNAAWASDPEKDAHVLATVNGSPITDADVNREMMMGGSKVPLKMSAYPDSQIEMTRKEFLNRLINFELLYQESQRKGIIIEQSTIGQRVRDLKSEFASQSAYTRYLDKMKLTESSLSNYMHRELAVERFINTIEAGRPPAGEEEKRQYYNKNHQQFKEPEQIHVHHIALRVGAAATEQDQIDAIEKLGYIRDKFDKNEASFASLAKSLSEDATAEKGGDLGYFQRGQLIEPFEKAAFSLEVGEISGIVITPYGYHLILVTDKKPEKLLPYEQVQDEISKILTVRRIKAAVADFLESSRNSSDIVIFTTL